MREGSLNVPIMLSECVVVGFYRLGLLCGESASIESLCLS